MTIRRMNSCCQKFLNLTKQTINFNAKKQFRLLLSHLEQWSLKISAKYFREKKTINILIKSNEGYADYMCARKSIEM